MSGRRGGSGTSWASVLIGWLAALGAVLILSGLVSAVVGAILVTLGFGGGAEAGTAGLIGVLVTLFLAFLVGGTAPDGWRDARGPGTAFWWRCSP